MEPRLTISPPSPPATPDWASSLSIFLVEVNPVNPINQPQPHVLVLTRIEGQLIDTTQDSLVFNIAGCLASHHRRSSEPHLRILPSGRQEIRAGKNLVLTCRAQVANIELVKHLKWINPRGQDIPQDDRWDHNSFQSKLHQQLPSTFLFSPVVQKYPLSSSSASHFHFIVIFGR